MLSLASTMLVTVALRQTAMVQPVMQPVMQTMVRTMVPMLSAMLVPKLDTGAGVHTTRLGDPLRGRALRCNLRCAPISAAIPVASVRFAHCALRLPGGSLRSPPRAGPTRSLPHSTTPRASPPRSPRHGAARRARREPRLARPGRLRRRRASPRLVAGALRASPVRASPVTRFRTAPCTGVRTSADISARASGSVLRTSACGPGRTARRSRAAAAPFRRLRRRRFPRRSDCTLAVPDRPGRPWVSHPTQLAAGACHWHLYPALSALFGDIRRQHIVGPSV